MPTNISRRSFLAVAGASAAATTFNVEEARASSRRPPNIVFIMADDLGFADLSCTGSDHISTPAIDSLAENGALLRHGYANSPICSPTRTALLTGCYQQRFRIGLEEPVLSASSELGLPSGTPTLSSLFRDAGYFTKLIGKWHLGAPPVHGPLQHGYDEFFGILEGGADYFRHDIIMGGKSIGGGLYSGNHPIKRDGYMTDLFGDEAARTIAKANVDQPLFLSLHFTAPHWPWQGPNDHEEVRNIPNIVHWDGGNLATYREMVESMDANIAKVLTALAEKGMDYDTIVVFTSDNGGERFSETWPFVGVKGELLEGGIRVPILVKWPGRIAKGYYSGQVMGSMDFLPTLLSLSNNQTFGNNAYDGLDLSAQLLGDMPIVRPFFWRFKANDQAAAREGAWKYLRMGEREYLFNLSKDERERANFIEHERGIAESLKRKHFAWEQSMLTYPADSYSSDVKVDFPDRY